MAENKLGDFSIKTFRLRPGAKGRPKSMGGNRLAGLRVFPVAAAMQPPDRLNDRLVVDRVIYRVGKQRGAAFWQRLEKLDC